MAKNNYWISRSGSDWKAKKEGASKAAGVFDTQRQAENFARNIMKNNGGGELVTKDQHGKIRIKDTINSRDPNPPKDREN